MSGRGRQRTSFGKLQRERARQEKQAAKRAKRHGIQEGGIPEGPRQSSAVWSNEEPTAVAPQEADRTP
jgi:hypothetical protein